jgi:integrase
MTYIDAHLDNLRWRNLSSGTIYQRNRLLHRLSLHVDPLAASAADLLLFLDRRQLDGSRLGPATRAVEISHLAAFYQWAVLEELRADDPTVRVPRPKLPRRLPRPMSEPDLTRAIAGAPLRVLPWLYLAAFAGLRACEIAPLRGEDIWWHATPPLIVVQRGKGGDPGTVPLAPPLVPVLRSLPRTDWLFPHGHGIGHVKPHGVSRASNAYLHSIGITETLHSLRHRFCTQVYRASGRDLRQTQELARHRSIQSTVLYTQVDLTEGAGILAGLPAVG